MIDTLIVKNLTASVNGKIIIEGINLEIKRGEVCALMGPNGSGKSTLANVIMGNPKYKIEAGTILINNEDITKIKVNEKAHRGLFMSFQYPSEVGGVTISNFLRTAYNSIKKTNISVIDFQKSLKEKMKLIDMADNFSRRYLNDGFSGGEKKKTEILQMLMLEPKFALLDETDSGTDIDSIKSIANAINKVRIASNMGILIITHYQKFLNYIKPDKIFIMIDGKIVKEGDSSLALRLEELGYEWVKENKVALNS